MRLLLLLASVLSSSPSLDAGVPKSDDCMGADLEEGRCQCAHTRCMDTCCPRGWVCAHSGATTAKCIRPR